MAETRYADPELITRILQKGLEDKVREALKAPIMEMAEKMVDEAVDEAVKGLEFDITQYREAHNMRDVIHVVLHKEKSEE